MTAAKDEPKAGVARVRNLTQHELTVPGSSFSANMLIDDHGAGHVVISTQLGPAFTVKTRHLPAIRALLAAAQKICEELQPLPENLTVEDVVRQTRAADGDS